MKILLSAFQNFHSFPWLFHNKSKGNARNSVNQIDGFPISHAVVPQFFHLKTRESIKTCTIIEQDHIKFKGCRFTRL